MRVKCTSDNRDLILSILQKELGKRVVYHPLPEFAYTVGRFKLKRDGCIEISETDPDDISRSILNTLAELGLCEGSIYPQEGNDLSEVQTYPMEGHTGSTLTNLLCIMSARQKLINSALGCPGAFFISPELMNDLLDHAPLTIEEFLQSTYGREKEHKGLVFSRSKIVFVGFGRCTQDESYIHSQLANLILNAAVEKNWVKPFIPDVRNRKYAFRTWLNSIGMTGPEYKEARRIMLARLYGRSDQRRIPAESRG